MEFIMYDHIHFHVQQIVYTLFLLCGERLYFLALFNKAVALINKNA